MRIDEKLRYQLIILIKNLDKWQVLERLVSTLEHSYVSPERDRTCCLEEYVSVGMSHTLQMLFGNCSYYV